MLSIATLSMATPTVILRDHHVVVHKAFAQVDENEGQ